MLVSELQTDCQGSSQDPYWIPGGNRTCDSCCYAAAKKKKRGGGGCVLRVLSCWKMALHPNLRTGALCRRLPSECLCTFLHSSFP